MIVRLMLHPYKSNIKEKAVKILSINQNKIMRAQQERVVKDHVKESCHK